MEENDVYETKKKFRKRDLFFGVLKMSSSMIKMSLYRRKFNYYCLKEAPPFYSTAFGSVFSSCNGTSQVIKKAGIVATNTQIKKLQYPNLSLK
ncbi:MAG: hypothetical protein RIR11_4501 [Bacteroidota bacterium]|jgi:hypothetical protein